MDLRHRVQVALAPPMIAESSKATGWRVARKHTEGSRCAPTLVGWLFPTPITYTTRTLVGRSFMNWPDIWQSFLAIIGAIGGLSLIVAGLATWIGRILADRMQSRTNAAHAKELEEIRSEYNTDLERIKAEMSERRDLLSVSLHALQSGYSSSHEEIIKSIGLLTSGAS